MKQWLLILLIASVSFSQMKKIEKSFSDATKLEMKTGSGDVNMMKSTDGKVHVMVEHSYDEEDFKPTIEQRGNKVIIKERRRNNWGWNNSGSAVWTIKIPNDMEVSFGTGSGDFSAEDIKFSEFDGGTGSGDFTFRDTSGDMEIGTGSGDINFKTHEGYVKCSAGSGDIELDKLKGELKVSVGSGDIEISQSEGEFKLTTGSGNIDARAVKILKSADITTGSGDIEIVLSAALKDDLELTAGSGDITLDYDGNDISGYFEFEARYENRIKTPFKYKTEKKLEDGRHDRFLKTAEVNGTDISIYMRSGSGTVKVTK